MTPEDAVTLKDWQLIVIGAVVGWAVTVVLQHIQSLIHRKNEERRIRKEYNRINEAWTKFEKLFPNLHLLQAGWPPTGYFTPEQVRIRLQEQFKLPDQIRCEIRQVHQAEWLAQNYTDGEQVGIKTLRIFRTSDEPSDELSGRSHFIQIEAHSYKYFDFLATHRRLTKGSAEEQQLLRSFVGTPNAEQAVAGFPNPLSVGLSLFCENSDMLVLLVRTIEGASGGEWHGGKLFNAVGENVTPSDFSASIMGHKETSPYVVAKRGLHQEVGFSEEDIRCSTVSIHSLAWASDILDHKFFGLVTTPLTRSEIKQRWENAPDRGENRDILFYSVRNAKECSDFFRSVFAQKFEWSPEAIFCTARSLVSLRKIDLADLIHLNKR